ncbi:MAG: cytochrome bc complex cytochrome b subunit [Nitrospirota bacterium]|nr:cytochrome bc complex cytochrome b subunit [Nitrospirota bacterium]
MWQRIKQGLETRIGLEDLINTKLKSYSVPRNTNIFYTLGGVALVAFIIQAISGFFLLIYYVPHSDHAFRSVQYIMTTAPFGWLFRLMHVVGSNLMVAVIFLHLLSVFFMGSYKKPRELTWIAGWLMLLVTLTFCLSGYLLPWSQLSYWTTTVVTAMPTAFPYVGDYIANLLRGGEFVSGITLNRFFALHVAFLPPILVGLMVIHVFLIRRIGLSSPPFDASSEETKPWTEYRHVSYPNGNSFYPYFVLKELYMVALYLVVMFFVITFMPTLFLPEASNIPANPLMTPAYIKPQWYFLAPYQMLKLIPNKFLGISMQIALIGTFLLWPFFDTKTERNILKRPLLLATFTASLVLWVVLTMWGRSS